MPYRPNEGHLVRVLREFAAYYNPGMIQSMYALMLKAGLSQRSVEQVHTLLHRALSQAMRWGLTNRNPAQPVSPPGPGRQEMTALSSVQLRRLAHTEGSRWNPLRALIASTRLRKGEALALGCQDVDLDARKLVVRLALQRQPGVGVVWRVVRL